MMTAKATLRFGLLSPSPRGRGAGGGWSPAHDLLNMNTPERHA